MTEKDQQVLRRVRAWLDEHRQEMIDELKLWVSQPSVSRADLAEPEAPFGPDCRKMLSLVLERGRHYGYETEDYAGYVGCILVGEGKKELGMVCHLDVVPEGDHWIYQPYAPIVKDGWMIGRGCGDDKGPGVLSLFAARCIQEIGVPMQHKIRLLFGCSEETGMDDFPVYFNKLNGPAPDVSLVSDSSFPVCVGQKGMLGGMLKVDCGKNVVDAGGGSAKNIIPDYAYVILSGISVAAARQALAEHKRLLVEEDAQGVKISVLGKSGHAAFPEGTENAIALLTKELTDSPLMEQLDLKGISFLAKTLDSCYGEGLDVGVSDELSGKLTMNGGILSQKDGKLQVTIDIRFPVTLDGEQLLHRAEECAKRLGGSFEDASIDKPYYIDPKDPKVTVLMDIYNDLTGENAEPYTMGGGTYSRVVPNAMTFGPSIPGEEIMPDFLPEGHGGAHGPDEALRLESWFKGFEIYVMSLIKLDALV